MGLAWVCVALVYFWIQVPCFRLVCWLRFSFCFGPAPDPGQVRGGVFSLSPGASPGVNPPFSLHLWGSVGFVTLWSLCQVDVFPNHLKSGLSAVISMMLVPKWMIWVPTWMISLPKWGTDTLEQLPEQTLDIEKR